MKTKTASVVAITFASLLIALPSANAVENQAPSKEESKSQQEEKNEDIVSVIMKMFGSDFDFDVFSTWTEIMDP